jgi:gamma-glutamyltranspeptidase/glutathione hydrolase
MILRSGESVTALATPGADGQVQTLLQILAKTGVEGAGLAAAIHAPRWRSEDGALLVAEGHPEAEPLRALGHRVEMRADSDLCFGGVVCAGTEAGRPFAGSDWRREVWHAVR